MTTAPRKTKRARPGQPRKPLAEREDRFWLAFAAAVLDAHEQFNTGQSINSLVQNLVAFKYGAPVLTPENLEANAQGRPVAVHIDKRRSKAQPSLGNGQRHRNPLHGLADDELAHPIRRTKRLPRDNPDRMWLAAMVWAMRLACCGDQKGEPIARSLAGAAGEAEFFERVLLPILRRDPARTIVVAALLDLLSPPEK